MLHGLFFIFVFHFLSEYKVDPFTPTQCPFVSIIRPLYFHGFGLLLYFNTAVPFVRNLFVCQQCRSTTVKHPYDCMFDLEENGTHVQYFSRPIRPGLFAGCRRVSCKSVRAIFEGWFSEGYGENTLPT